VWQVVGEVFALNLVLATLAIISTLTQQASIQVLLLAIGGTAVALMMRRFSQQRASSS
jgi:hypothetical protein